MNWRSLFQGRQLEKQLDSELRSHIEARVSDLVIAGLTEQEARRRDQLEFGRVERVKEETRDSWGWMWLERLSEDLHYGGFDSLPTQSEHAGIQPLVGTLK
jgi:hypothetical protein